MPPFEILSEGWVFPTLKSVKSPSMDNLRGNDNGKSVAQRNQSDTLYEYFKLSYAEILHRWGLLHNRVEVLKYMCEPPESHKGVEFAVDCKHCRKQSRHSSCSNCKKFVLNCIICHLSVRGSANCCIICGHGGHTEHLKQWFEKRELCPSGCGCHCLLETSNMFKI